MKLVVTLLLAACLLSACTGKDGSLDLRKPVSLDLDPPEGPPEYEQGWTDGCETGSNAYANNFYKFIKAFDLRLDPVLRNNKMYYQAWRDAFRYCAMYWETINRKKI